MKKNNDHRVIKSLTPCSLDISVDGQIIRVATERHENAIMNMIMACQMRALLQKQVKNYYDEELKMTPKELSDLTAAARNIASFSGEVYGAADPINKSTKPSEQKVAEEGVDFTKLTQKPAIDVKVEPKPEGEDGAGTDAG